ncbi:MAG: hypothetical protein ACTSRD_13025 [Promethearchaeota archaeon]
MRDKYTWKTIILAGFIIGAFAGGFFVVELYLGTPIPSIPEGAQYASILEIYHPESTEIQNSLPIDITFSFGNGASPLNIYTRLNVFTRKIELILWRPPGIYPAIYLERTIQHNVSFVKTGVWTLIINTDYQSTVHVL